MAQVSSTFAASGQSAVLFVKGGEQFRLTLSGTWVQTILVEETNNGVSYQAIDTVTANVGQVYPAKPYDRSVRLNSTRTSGTATYVIDNQSALYLPKPSSIPIGAVAYASLGTSAVGVAGSLYLASVRVNNPMTVTGIGALNGATVGTDKFIFALYDNGGNLIANTATAGVTLPTTLTADRAPIAYLY